MLETIEDLHKELIKLLEEDFANLENYLKTEQPKGYLSLVKKDTRLHLIEFSVGSYRLVLVAEIDISSRRVYYKTYKITLDTEDYPKEKLVYVENLDLITHFSFTRTFRVEKTLKYPSKMGLPNAVKSATFKTEDFGWLYIQQVEIELSTAS